MNEQVPVIAVISSYGTQGDESTPINIVSVGRGEFIFENFIPMVMHLHKLLYSEPNFLAGVLIIEVLERYIMQ